MGSYVAIPFGTETSPPRSGRSSLQRAINMYAEAAPEGAKGPVAMYPTPGLSSWTSVGDGPIRGMVAMLSDLYVVSGTELYVIDTAKTSTLLGTVAGSGHVHMTHNGTHVAICTNDKAYAANRSELLELPERNLNGATYQDGYGIFTQAQSQFFWISGVDDMTTIAGTDFTSADTLPDLCVGCVSDHRELWIFKQKSAEVFENTGNASFPFERRQIVERGAKSSGSITKIDNTVFWLGDDLHVYAAAGYQPQSISPPWIVNLIEATVDPGSAWGFTYEQGGHKFYALLFSDLSIVFDISTGKWHERLSDGLSRWRVGKYEYFANLPLGGDAINGNIYELSLTTYDDNGDTIIRTLTAPILTVGGNRAVMDEVYVEIEPGNGLATGQGSNPQIMLDWSDDGGKTWSDEIWAEAGDVGEYHRRATWNRLGIFRDRTVRVRISDPIRFVVVGAKARIQPVEF